MVNLRARNDVQLLMLQPPTGEKTVPVIGDPHGGTKKPIASRRELRLLVLGFIALAYVATFIYQGRERHPKGVVPAPTPEVVAAMVPADLSAMPPLPDAAAIAAARTDVAAMIRERQVPSIGLGVDGSALAWAEQVAAEDRAAHRVPQRLSVDEIIHSDMRLGQLVIVKGRLEATAAAPIIGREAPDGYEWMSLALEDQQYILVLAKEDLDRPELILNSRVQMLGRYWGRTLAPTANGEQPMHCFQARVVVPLPESDPSAGIAKAFQGQVQIPNNLFEHVDDELPLVETQPYYVTLGQVKREAGTPELLGKTIDANATANLIHQDPAAYRGKLMTVIGVVYDAWEDRAIPTDRPYDIPRVVRVLIYRRDIGDIEENGKIQTKSVLRVYEMAAITDQPLPKPGEFIGATGRFVKWRAIPVDKHPSMDQLLGVKRHSNKVYTMFLVTGAWHTVVVQRIDWTPILIILGVLGGGFTLLILWVVNRDRGAERRLHASVTALRKQRRSLKHKGVGASDAAPTVTDAADANEVDPKSNPSA